jgi:hypothetical protein
MNRLTKYLVIVGIVAGFGLFVLSCNVSFLPKSGNTGDTATVLLRVMIPDYANHILPEEPAPPTPGSKALSSSLNAKAVSPDTANIQITISGPGISPDIFESFSFLEHGGWYHGEAWVECEIPGVPLGVDRLIEVVATDDGGTPLTQGEILANIDANLYNQFEVALVPVSPAVLSLNTAVDDSVDYGSMDFYSLDLSPLSGNLCLVTLESLLFDLDLYAYNYEGYPEELDCWELGAPTDEWLVLDTNWGSDEFYIGVFGNSLGGSNPYTILAEPYVGTPFPGNFVQTTALGSFSSISSSGEMAFQEQMEWEEYLQWNDCEEAEIGFTFEYNGVGYDTAYISSYGYITFWPFKCDWASEWDFGSSSLPNNLVAVYMAQLGFDFDSGQGVYYETSGSAPNRTFTVEYHHVDKIHWSVGITGSLTAQIVLHEGSNAIELLYDRSDVPGSDGAVGLENDDGLDTLGPGYPSGVPASDLRFEYE